MGTEYYVGCVDCAVCRDIDKAYFVQRKMPENRKEMKEFMEDIQERPFHAATTLSFLIEHAGHKCKIFSEHDIDYSLTGFSDETISVIGVDGPGFKEEATDFWSD